MNQLLYSEKTEENHSKKVVFLAIGAFLVFVLVIVFLLSKPTENKVLANVYVEDVNIGLREKEEAVSLVNDQLFSGEKHTVSLFLGDRKVTISAEEVGFGPDKTPEEVVEEAYQYGRDGNVFSNGVKVFQSHFKDTVYEVNYTLDEKKLEKVLTELTSGDSEISKDDAYVVSGDEIIITKGTDGVKIDKDEAKEFILTAFCNQVPSVTIPTTVQKSKVLDIDKLYKEVAVEPVNAKLVSGEKFEIISEKNGISFDKAAVKVSYDALANGESMTVTLTPVEAKVKTADIETKLFETKLASYSTTTENKGANRTKNVVTTCSRINNKIVNPGETFSFNEAMGPVTTKNGFAMGSGFEGGKIVSMIGGGMCQVSTTLYDAVLVANLEVVDRTAHGMPVTYGKPGLDATFMEDAIDFQFKNTRNYPIKITASENNGTVLVEIYGMKEENEPIIELESVVVKKIEATTIKEEDATLEAGKSTVTQTAMDGYEAEGYKVVKDKDGKVISRTLLSKDTYSPINQIVKVGTKEVATPTPTQQPTTPTKPTTPSGHSEDPEIVVYDEEPTGSGKLPSGWDSPESPYGRH